jgi:hypothetical protein
MQSEENSPAAMALAVSACAATERQRADKCGGSMRFGSRTVEEKARELAAGKFIVGLHPALR